MIKKINLNKVASYKQPASLETEKKVNLVYGLNGTGKSTVSNYLYNPENSDYDYSNCSVERDGDEEILVYNQEFTRDNFDEDKSLPGVFSLAKENKQAKEKIRNAEELITKLKSENSLVSDLITSLRTEYETLKTRTQETIFKIKKDYSGGDRVLDYCLKGYKTKAPLFNHMVQLGKATSEPARGIPEIKKEIQSITESDDQKVEFLKTIKTGFDAVEFSPLFKKEIVGNDNSSISDLINHLGNSDWVKQGKTFIDIDSQDKEACPFCQEQTITESFKSNLMEFFNEVYAQDLESLAILNTQYADLLIVIPPISEYENSTFIIERMNEFKAKYNAVLECLQSNKKEIEQKIAAPSLSIELTDSATLLESFNSFIIDVNAQIQIFNEKIDNKNHSLRLLKDEFWRLMRWDYDQTIVAFNQSKEKLTELISVEISKQEEHSRKLAAQRAIIIHEQQNTVNIETAAENIKAQLIDLGITDFTLKKESSTSYRIVRGDDEQNIFRSLSEGEKMIISFLYFLELCKGKTNASDTSSKKIIVIDDPISSLSHIHIFNIGRLIQSAFINPLVKDKGTVAQIFIFTHSLYFYYELAEKNDDTRKANQNLVRLVKTDVGSRFDLLKYKSIQNDYQAYWAIIKDEKQEPAVIANCMRNVVEYFFSFTENLRLNEVFDKSNLKTTKYQAFYRYMNRESHSDGINLFDFKEFDYNVFMEAFKLLFTTSGYDGHLKRMMR